MKAGPTKHRATASRDGSSAVAPVRLLLLAICLLAGLVCASMLGEALLDMTQDAREEAVRADQDAIRDLRLSIAQANAALFGLILNEEPSFLLAFTTASKLTQEKGPEILRGVEADRLFLSLKDSNPLAEDLVALQQAWEIAVDSIRDHRPNDAMIALRTAHAQELSSRLNHRLDAFLMRQAANEAKRAEAIANWVMALRGVTGFGLFVSVAVMIIASRRIGAAIAKGRAASRQVERLFAMGDMLQSAADIEDLNSVLRATALQLLPGLSGALYVFNNSRDRLDLATKWGTLSDDHLTHLSPSACWALKR